MKSRLLFAVAAAVLSGFVSAQAGGADVIVGDIPDRANYAAVGGIDGFSFGTTSCNVGTVPLQWVASTNQHPVIAQNLYRIKGGRFEQIGMSWLKHGFTALAQNLCATCQNPGTGSLLGVNCSDPYSASLNGNQSSAGPRNEVNAATGYFKYPVGTAYPAPSGTIARRLQVPSADIDPTQNAGGTYLVEAQYVSPDDAAAGNKNNNASYRAVTFTAGTTAGDFNATLSGTTVRTKTAVEGWALLDPTVSITYYDIPNDGRFIVGKRALALGDGYTRYFYAVHNLNSDRSGKAFTVNFASAANVRGLWFNDVDYHSGEPYATTDWLPTVGTNSISWSTEDCATNPNANALRWGTCYSFEFESDTAPIAEVITPFKPTVNGTTCPPQPAIPSLGGYASAPVAYDFIPNVPTAGALGPGTDDSAATVALGFTFNFWGTNYTQMVISSNGYLAIPGQSGTVYQNTAIPAAAVPNGTICGYWDDLNPAATGSGKIYYQTVGTAPNRRFVVHWNGVYIYGTTQPENFQIILDETTNAITLTTVSTTQGGSSATRGVENLTGTAGLQQSYNAPASVVANTSYRFASIPPTVIPPSANLAWTGPGTAGSTLTIQLVSKPSLPLVLLADTSAGPFTIPGNLGVLDIGLSLGTIPIADGIGLFGYADPNAKTDCICGSFSVSIALPAGLAGLTLYSQGIVIDSAAPNGAFHITTPVSFTFQ